MRNAAALAMVALLVLALAACAGAKKLTASQTAEWIERHSPPNAHVRCEPAEYVWDYRCSRTYGDKTDWMEVSFYNVDAHKVTESSDPVNHL